MWFFTITTRFSCGIWRPIKLRNQPFCTCKFDITSGVVISMGFFSKLYEPRSPDCQKEVGFVRRPSVSVLWDDLHATAMVNASSISLMQKMTVPLYDLEEHVISIGTAVALNLLGASLTKNAALTEGLFYLLEKSN